MTPDDEYEVIVDKPGDRDRIKLKVKLMPGAHTGDAMKHQNEIQEIDEKIGRMKAIALELNQHNPAYPFLKRNTERILAGIKMLELNVSDIANPH